MAAYLALILTLFVGVCYGDPGRIVGGDVTSVERYPHIVQVDYLGTFSSAWSQTCAGTILNQFHILSAAHCFTGAMYAPQRRRIRAGATYRNTGGVVVNVFYAINHHTYGTNSFDGDISVVRVTTALQYSAVIQAASILGQSVSIPDGSAVRYAGWGATIEGGTASSVLQDVTVYTVNRQVCYDRYQEIEVPVTENMICASILDEGGKDICNGDSGGPLYFGSNDVVVGIISWSLGCAEPRFPGVSTQVSSYTNWIVSIVR